MRYLRYRLGIVVLSAMAVAVAGCKHGVPQAARVGQEPPLLLEEGDSSKGPLTTTGPMADNGRCHVCHINYADEKLAVVHARANVGCEQCHGASDAHCGDEDNITPPEIMYPAARINPSCMKCHPQDKIDTEPHGPIFRGTGTPKKVCTDCHGDHRLGYRTRRWDKTSGKLIRDDKVSMMIEDTLER